MDIDLSNWKTQAHCLSSTQSHQMSCMGQENLSNFWNEWGSILGESILHTVEIYNEEELKKQ